MKLPRTTMTLPSPLQRRLERTAAEFIFAGFGHEADFTTPAGEPALVAADSVSWRIFKNPLSLFIGGVAAVILELAEPRVRAGVWNHTSFRHDPLTRLRRTGLAAMMTVYGPHSRSKEMIAAVNKMHGRISGIMPDGQPYRADDPELLVWVQATASFGFLEAYAAYVRAVPAAQRNRYYAEGESVAGLYGASGAPTSQAALDALFDAMRDKLEPSPVIFEFLDIMQRVAILPPPFSSMQAWLVKAAVAIVPDWLRERLGLTRQWNLLPLQRELVRRGGTLADRIVLRSCPAVQSCRRLGLPDDYLYILLKVQ